MKYLEQTIDARRVARFLMFLNLIPRQVKIVSIKSQKQVVLSIKARYGKMLDAVDTTAARVFRRAIKQLLNF